MRRRRPARLRAAEQIVAALADAEATVDRWYPDPRDPRRVPALHRLLDEAGTDVIDALRARRALYRTYARRT